MSDIKPEDIKSKTITNVPQVDAKKRYNEDVGAELDYLEQKGNEERAKLAELETEASKLLDKWEQKNPDLKLGERATLRANPNVVPDYTNIPEFLYKRDGTRVRLRDDQNYEYRWTRAIGPQNKVSTARAEGWRPMRYDEFCKDTDCDWERYGAEGYILNGDTIMMRIDKRRAEARRARIRYLRELYEGAYEETLVDAGRDYGVQVYREEGGRGGKREFA